VLDKEIKSLKNKFCWKCKRKLNFREFRKRNNNLSKKRAAELWSSKYIEFFCCNCYDIFVLHEAPYSSENVATRRQDIKKIVFLGLGNSGKSAIVKMLKTQCLQSSLNLCPTKGIDISELTFASQRFVIWDFGGAETYLKKWLERPIGFGYLSELFYCIDITDKTNFNKAFDYFFKIYPVLQKIDSDSGLPFEQNFKIIFLFHKLDPFMKTSPAIKERLKSVKKRVKAFDLIYDSTILHTSLYNFKYEDYSALRSDINDPEDLNMFNIIKSLLQR